MSAGTKIFLALFGLFVLLVVFYYGLWTPGDPADDDLPVDIETQQPADPPSTLTIEPATGNDHRRADARPAGIQQPSRNTRAATPPPAQQQPANTNPINEIRMGGKVGIDGPIAANAAMEINGETADSESAAAGARDVITTDPVRKSVDLVAVAQYQIREGDTLSSIAARWFGDAQKWDLIKAVNPGLEADKLRLGQMIKLPDRQAQRPTTGVLATNMPEMPTSRSEYIVKPDDSLSTIAQQHYGKASKWALIYEANKEAIGPDPDVLREGMKLILPPA